MMRKEPTPRHALDDAQCVPRPSSKAQRTSYQSSKKKERQRKYPKPPEKPHKIQAALLDPEKRTHLGPCCVTYDGTIRGTKKWGDGKGSLYMDSDLTDPTDVFYECMGCRKMLEKPPPAPHWGRGRRAMGLRPAFLHCPRPHFRPNFLRVVSRSR